MCVISAAPAHDRQIANARVLDLAKALGVPSEQFVIDSISYPSATIFKMAAGYPAIRVAHVSD